MAFSQESNPDQSFAVNCTESFYFISPGFKKLPEQACVINCGRGQHLVLPDLVAALDSGHLRGQFLMSLNGNPLSKPIRYGLMKSSDYASCGFACANVNCRRADSGK